MRISVNLASRPFIELRPLFARLRLLMAGLAVLAIALGFGLVALNKKADAATAQMNSLRAQTERYQQERAQNEARMRQPRNAGVLERSRFLNSLFARKSFSWTAVMMDLERVLPPAVQVTSIDPVISKEGDVTIRLRVTGDRDRAIQLVRNLEHSQRFLAPRLASESALSADRAKTLGVTSNTPGVVNASLPVGALPPSNGVEFEIFSGYNPLPEPRSARRAIDEAEDAPDILQPKVHHNRKPNSDLRFPPPPSAASQARPSAANPGGAR